MDTVRIHPSPAGAQSGQGVNLSQWVDVGAGGITPGDDPRTPVWSQGGPAGPRLSAVALTNRPFTINLLLAAASRPALHSLQQSIEAVLSADDPVLQWQPEGAAGPTWWRIRFGRVISTGYDARREAQTFYARRLLALVCEPFGAGRLPVSFGSVVSATGPGWASLAWGWGMAPSNPLVARMPSVGGDAPPRWGIAAAAVSASQTYSGATAAVTIRVVGGFAADATTPMIGASGITMMFAASWAVQPTMVASDLTAPGIGYAALPAVPLATNGEIDTSSLSGQKYVNVYPAMAIGAFDLGPVRVFAAARNRQATAGAASSHAALVAGVGGVIGPVATMLPYAPSAWVWYDLGDFTVGNESISIWSGVASGYTAAASHPIGVSAVALIPKRFGYFDVMIPQSGMLDAALGVWTDTRDGDAQGVIVDTSLPMDWLNTSESVYKAPVAGDAPAVVTSATPVYLKALVVKETYNGWGQDRLDRAILGLHARDSYTFVR